MHKYIEGHTDKICLDNPFGCLYNLSLQKTCLLFSLFNNLYRFLSIYGKKWCILIAKYLIKDIMDDFNFINKAKGEKKTKTMSP